MLVCLLAYARGLAEGDDGDENIKIHHLPT